MSGQSVPVQRPTLEQVERAAVGAARFTGLLDLQKYPRVAVPRPALGAGAGEG